MTLDLLVRLSLSSRLWLDEIDLILIQFNFLIRVSLKNSDHFSTDPPYILVEGPMTVCAHSLEPVLL